MKQLAISLLVTSLLFIYPSCNTDKSMKEKECPVAVVGNQVIDPLEIPLSDIASIYNGYSFGNKRFGSSARTD